jgi:hypothetical protein
VKATIPSFTAHKKEKKEEIKEIKKHITDSSIIVKSLQAVKKKKKKEKKKRTQRYTIERREIHGCETKTKAKKTRYKKGKKHSLHAWVFFLFYFL